MKFFSLTTVKKGSSDQESDDAFFFEYKPKKSEGSTHRSRFAISDGATESSFSHIWADILVKDYCQKGFKSAGGLENRLNTVSKKWTKKIPKENLPWYAEEKVKSGAFSTLLGLEFEGIKIHKKLMDLEQITRSGKWSAIALGDSCLFHIRDNQLIKSFPLEKASEFNNSPVLLSSNLQKNTSVLSSVKVCHESWKPGDEFFICTDAFAFWFLSETENNHKPWIEFLAVINDPNPLDKFKSWVITQRDTGLLKNDDTSVIILKI